MIINLSNIPLVALCGGKGTRLWPLTKDLPKPLVLLQDKPIIEHLMEISAAQGIRKFILLTGYQADKFETFCEKIRKEHPDWEVQTSNAGENAEMTQRLGKVSSMIPEKAIVCYGDTFCDVNLKELVHYHEQKKEPVTVTLYQLKSPFGIIETDSEGVVSNYQEKPTLPHWFSIGYYVMEKEVFSGIEKFDKMESFLTHYVKGGLMNGYRHKGKHITINTEAERKAAEQELSSFYSDIEVGKL